MASTWRSDVPRMLGHCITTTRVSILSFSLPLWMPITSSCRWMWVLTDPALMRRDLTGWN